MTTLYHGTTIENYKEILKNGFEHDSVIWGGASDSDNMYFWSPIELMRCEDIEELEDAEFSAQQRAAESAMITATLQKTKYEHIIVLSVQVQEEFISLDDSCENMSDSGAVQVATENLKPEMIKQVYFADFVASLSLFYITGLLNNNFVDLYEFLTQVELDALESISKSDFYIGEEFCYPETFVDENYHYRLTN